MTRRHIHLIATLAAIALPAIAAASLTQLPSAPARTSHPAHQANATATATTTRTASTMIAQPPPRSDRPATTAATAEPTENAATASTPSPTTAPPAPVVAPVPTTIAALAPGCPGVSYFDPLPGDSCASTGGSLDDEGWVITATSLTGSVSDAGRPQLCTTITAVNHRTEEDLMTGLAWYLESQPAGSPTAHADQPIGGTLNETGYIQPAGTTEGTVCFADTVAPGQLLIVFGPTTANRAIWITSR